MRARAAVVATTALALVLAVAGWAFVVDWHHVAGAQPSSPSGSQARQASPEVASVDALSVLDLAVAEAAARATASHSPRPQHRSAPTSAPTSQPATSAHPVGTTAAGQAAPTRATSAPPPAPAPVHYAPVGGSPSGAAAAVFSELNDERAAHGLGPLRWSSALASSASQHTQAMAGSNTLGHQLPGEADPGARMNAAGYSWSSWGENCGYDPGSAVAVQRSFYAEGPGGIHYQNTMSTTFVDVGIGVVYADGKYWVTEDFGRPL